LRDKFQELFLVQLLEMCNLSMPSKKVMSLFDSVPNSFDRQAAPQDLLTRFQPNTREWIFDKVESWGRNLERHKVHALIGQGGVGKSTVAAELVRRGNRELGGNGCGAHDNNVVAYHFFHHVRQNSVRNCLMSISAQLRLNVPGFREAFDAMDLDATLAADKTTNKRQLMELYFYKLILEPARIAGRGADKSRVMVVVDALDECADSDIIGHILEVIWVNDAPKWLSVFFTARTCVSQ
jgi:hypothetical protein